MKKFITLFYLLLFCIVSIQSNEICQYISDNGDHFYYIKYSDRGYTPSYDEIDFVNAQGIYVVVSTKNKVFDKNELVETAREIFIDSIRNIYESNKDYMWENYPEHKYTFNDVYSVIKRYSTTMITFDMFGDACSVNISLNIHTLLHKNNLREIEEYPYILGYIYKTVKYQDGKKCKIQDLSYLFDN